MPGKTILAIDQGTTNTKALLVHSDGSILASASRPITLKHPEPGWAEQSPDEIWGSVVSVIADLVAAAPETEPAALAISNQRETILLWDSITGRAVAPAISWQCRRSSERCRDLRAAGHEPLISQRTGLGLDPLFPAAKLGWLLDDIASARSLAADGLLRAGTVDAWLLWNLTGGGVHATDHGNAARTQLFNLHTLEWDPELADLFDVPLGLLPEVRSSDSLFGHTAAGVTALPPGVPIHAVMGDSHAALFGHGASRSGLTKVTIGTGSSIMTRTRTFIQSSHGLSTTIAWSRDGTVSYALEGNITVSGQAAAFTNQLLGIDNEDALTRLAQGVEHSDGVVFVPALAGLGAPHWQDQARGLLTGMTLGTRPAHVARATLEAIALQIVDVCEAIEADLGHQIQEISTDGGATRNVLLLNLLADLLDRPVVRQANAEMSALGVARMAAEALGIAGQAPSGAAGAERFHPSMTAGRRASIKAGWRSALRRASLDV